MANVPSSGNAPVLVSPGCKEQRKAWRPPACLPPAASNTCHIRRPRAAIPPSVAASDHSIALAATSDRIGRDPSPLNSSVPRPPSPECAPRAPISGACSCMPNQVPSSPICGPRASLVTPPPPPPTGTQRPQDSIFLPYCTWGRQQQPQQASAAAASVAAAATPTAGTAGSFGAASVPPPCRWCLPPFLLPMAVGLRRTEKR